MASEPIRDPVKDPLLTPKNSALLIIDYQPIQVSSVASMDRRALVQNIVTVANLARLYQLPIVLSTVNAKTGAPTIHQLQEVLGNMPAYDRTSITAHETALERISQAGAKLVTWVGMACELQRDWARQETAKAFGDIVFTVEGR